MLLSRALMRYRRIDLSGLPTADRAGALRAQLLAWQPFADSEMLIDLQADQAQVFAVARDVLQSANVASERLWPETLCHAPLPDGLHLVQCLEGVEGQVWSGGRLRSSRWWAVAPDAAEWASFARLSRVAAALAQVVPALESPAWVRPARAIQPMGSVGQGERGRENLIVGGAALVLVVFGGMTLRAAWDAHAVRDTAVAALEARREEAKPLLDAREKALSLADRSSALIEQLQAPRPLEVMDELARRLPKGSLVRELDLNQLAVRVVLDLPADVSRATLVEELLAGGWFTQVSEVKDGMPRSGMALEMKLSGVMPPVRALNADAGLKRSAADVAAPPPPVDISPLPKPGAKLP